LEVKAGPVGVVGVSLRASRSDRPLDPGTPKEARSIAKAFEAFFDGDPHALDDVPVDLGSVHGGFRRSVLETLHRLVGPGETVSYAELAEMSGRPGAARAVGTVMARNPMPIVVPCHRVVASNGGLGGYGGGLEMKRALLELEGALILRAAK
jgi:methylated-DNA-[protein]-cysteine S-methyltransferase